MSKKQLVTNNAHIPTEEIKQDILDTELEIAQFEVEAEHLEKTPLSMPSARWDHMRGASRRSGIKERKKFIKKLKTILKHRGI